jgi:hypothetical protein
MTQSEALTLLRESYRETVSRRGRTIKVSTIRRYLRYAMDILDIYLDIQRDRRWRSDDW